MAAVEPEVDSPKRPGRSPTAAPASSRLNRLGAAYALQLLIVVLLLVLIFSVPFPKEFATLGNLQNPDATGCHPAGGGGRPSIRIDRRWLRHLSWRQHGLLGYGRRPRDAQLRRRSRHPGWARGGNRRGARERSPSSPRSGPVPLWQPLGGLTLLHGFADQLSKVPPCPVIASSEFESYYNWLASST